MQIKKTIYVTLTVLLGLILSYIFHAATEIVYIKSSQQVVWYKHFGIGSCALPPFVQYGFFIFGLIGGFFLGKYWWKIVYIKKHHRRFKNSETN